MRQAAPVWPLAAVIPLPQAVKTQLTAITAISFPKDSRVTRRQDSTTPANSSVVGAPQRLLPTNA
jgi:hypothetical protein